MELNRKYWGGTSHVVSPNYARAYQAQRYAQYLKRRALLLERQVRHEVDLLVKESAPSDQHLAQRMGDTHMLEQYNRVILPLLLMAMQVEHTAEELRQISDTPLPESPALR